MQILKPHKPKEATKQKYYWVDTSSHTRQLHRQGPKNGQELGNELPENMTTSGTSPVRTPCCSKLSSASSGKDLLTGPSTFPLALRQALPMSVPFLVGVSMIHLGPCPNRPGGRNKETLAPFLSTVGGGASSTRLHTPGGPRKEREEDLETQ